MDVVDPGHKFLLDGYDGNNINFLVFMKRIGEKYPGNIYGYSGTNIQEVERAIISRVKYLNNQVPCEENEEIIDLSRRIIYLLERRAASRHGTRLEIPLGPIEEVPTCNICGHIFKHKCERMETK